MIISGSKRFILFHVPKTGGDATQQAMQGLIDPAKGDLRIPSNLQLVRNDKGKLRFAPKRWFRERNPDSWQDAFAPVPELEPFMQKGPRLVLHKHSVPTRTVGLFTEDFWAGLKTLVVVRNPYARAYSAYHFKLREIRPDDIKPHDPVRPDGTLLSLEEFLREKKIIATQPMVDWIDPDRPYDFILRTESLADDIETVLPQLGYSSDQTQAAVAALRGPRVNASTQPDDWKSMSDEARQLVRKIYRKDFETFGYDMDDWG